MSIAEKVLRAKTDYDAVYESGYEKGKAEGTADSYYDTFWDSYQDNGKRTHYLSGFSGKGWNDETFNPKYPLKPTNMQMMFQQSNITQIGYDVEIDFANAPALYETWRNSTIEKIKLIDISNTNDSHTFMCGFCSYLHTIEKIKVSALSTFVSNMFQSCTALVTAIFEGEIANNCPCLWPCSSLSKESITSVINILSATAEGLSVTFSLKAVNKAFETSNGVLDGSTSDEWKNLIATKPNWTIALG